MYCWNITSFLWQGMTTFCHVFGASSVGESSRMARPLIWPSLPLLAPLVGVWNEASSGLPILLTGQTQLLRKIPLMTRKCSVPELWSMISGRWRLRIVLTAQLRRLILYRAHFKCKENIYVWEHLKVPSTQNLIWVIPY